MENSDTAHCLHNMFLIVAVFSTSVLYLYGVHKVVNQLMCQSLVYVNVNLALLTLDCISAKKMYVFAFQYNMYLCSYLHNHFKYTRFDL